MGQPVPAQVVNVNGGVDLVNPADLIAGKTLQQWQRDAATGRYINIQNAVFYDTATVVAGTALTQGTTKTLFAKGKSEDDVVWNTGTAIPQKGEFMTNMITGGQFEGGTSFIMEQICVTVRLTESIATTYGTRGEITAPNYTASAVISMSNNLQAFTENIELQYLRNETVMLRGLLEQFPSPFGYSGAVGNTGSGFVQNGYNQTFNFLFRPVLLQTDDLFNFVLNPVVATFTPTMTAKIRVTLIGKKISSLIQG